jgi:hypothetical protein
MSAKPALIITRKGYTKVTSKVTWNESQRASRKSLIPKTFLIRNDALTSALCIRLHVEIGFLIEKTVHPANKHLQSFSRESREARDGNGNPLSFRRVKGQRAWTPSCGTDNSLSVSAAQEAYDKPTISTGTAPEIKYLSLHERPPDF